MTTFEALEGRNRKACIILSGGRKLESRHCHDRPWLGIKKAKLAVLWFLPRRDGILFLSLVNHSKLGQS